MQLQTSKLANEEIRNLIAKRRLKYWEVAKVIGYTPSYFSLLLRSELPNDKKKQFLDIIKNIQL